MRKQILPYILVFFLFASPIHSQTQGYVWGIKMGYTSSFMQNIRNESPHHGFHFGASLRHAFKENTAFTPSLLFENKGFQHQGIISSDSTTLSYDCSAFYLSLPLIFQHRIAISPHTHLLLDAGVYLAFGISGTRHSQISSTPQHTKAQSHIPPTAQSYKDIEIFSTFANRWDYGLEGGIGLNFSHFELSAHYDWGVGIFHRLPGGNYLRYSTWRFSLTYYL